MIPPLLYLQLLFVRAQTQPLRTDILEAKGHLACLQLMSWSSRFYLADGEKPLSDPEPWILELQIQAMQLLDALTIESPGCIDRTYTLKPYAAEGGRQIHKTLAELAAADGVEVVLHIFRQSLPRQHYTLPFCFRLLGRFLNYGTRQARQLIADTEVITQFTTYYVPPKKPCPLSATVEYEATAFTQLLLQWLSKRSGAAQRVDEAAVSSDKLASETPYPRPARGRSGAGRGGWEDDEEEEEEEERKAGGWGDDAPTPIAGGTGRRSAGTSRARSGGAIIMPLRGYSDASPRSAGGWGSDGSVASPAPQPSRSRVQTGGSRAGYGDEGGYGHGKSSAQASRSGSRAHTGGGTRGSSSSSAARR